jgi:hypothetical protein
MTLALTLEVMGLPGLAMSTLPSSATPGTRLSVNRARAADGAGVCSQLADFYCSPAASHWADGDTIRGSKQS